MRYNFERLDGKKWYKLIKFLRGHEFTFKKVNSEDLYNNEVVSDIFTVYYYATISGCKLIYYEPTKHGVRKRFKEISFQMLEVDVARCVLTFKKIAKKYNENIGYEPNKVYENNVYNFFSNPYKGYSTALDMNSAYLFALGQKLADWESRREIPKEDVLKKEYDYYSFENGIHCTMYYKEQQLEMKSAMLWADTKVYAYESKHYFTNTIEELYKLKNTDKIYKQVANIYIGCMHKHSGKQNNTTIAASLYAWFEWYMNDLVVKFRKKGYNVIMVTTDSIKVAGKYNELDKFVQLGDKLGQFKIEFEGESKFYSSGHYEDDRVKWKGMPQYMCDGYRKCTFIENIEEEKEVWRKYAITNNNKSKGKENANSKKL